MGISALWSAPEVNPINKKARSIPILNPINNYGRVFFFSWFGFLLAFWSWYAFPPLLSDVIAKDIGLSKHEIANSNIIALTATLLVRLVAGPACDRFGPRYTFAGCLLLGALPTFLAGTVTSAAGLYVLRFFIGILGGSFVPCQVWTTGFYDKNIIGTANSLTAGLGNSGGGITYFVMPAIYTSLMRDQGLTGHVAWRVAFVVPGILITSVALALFFLCDDTPTGKWADRFQTAETNLRSHALEGAIVDVQGTGEITGEKARKEASRTPSTSDIETEEKKLDNTRGTFSDNEAHMGEEQMLDTVRGEVVQKPSFKDAIPVLLSPQTLVLGICYFCTFGCELSVNSILGNYYRANLKLGLQDSGNWAAMFGLLNIVFRPLGGLVSDYAYKMSGPWGKKVLLHVYVTLAGMFMVITGAINPHSRPALVGLVTGGVGFFLEGANGLNYSLVPHVHPHANGIVSGVVGASGNLGGIIFAIIFRYSIDGKTTLYGQSFLTIGAIMMGMGVLTSWIRPVPKGQIGGR
ncbi:nitrate transporter [Aureobasidium sp. EXF-10727]|nr:nitrate transporter [Aureobasidium sp. EXF-10727]